VVDRGWAGVVCGDLFLKFDSPWPRLRPEMVGWGRNLPEAGPGIARNPLLLLH
jgi:hypothetical protein